MRATVAYFSMEIGLDAAIPTYSGGLGILAGDTIRSAADMGINMVAVTLLQRYGYFHQKLDSTGWQTEEPSGWPVKDFLQEIPVNFSVSIEDRKVDLRVWRYIVKGIKGHEIPVYFLDADSEGNSVLDRSLTHYLYGGDLYYRLCQDLILGIGGVRALRALGYSDIRRFHMNEGHSSLLVIELLRELAEKHNGNYVNESVLGMLHEMCVFTTHTPVPAGHDQFPMHMARQVLQKYETFRQLEDRICCNSVLNMTYLALNNSYYINGVAKKHQETSQKMFADFNIHSITNGVHLATWASEAWQRLFDKYVPGWREDNTSIRCIISLDKDKIWQAHQQSKAMLLDYINETAEPDFDYDTLTIGFARRATQYKRPDLLFHDLDKLNRIADSCGKLQLIFAGKAHPHDQIGKELIQKIHRIKTRLSGNIKLVYLNEYNITFAQRMVAGVDLWLNTPRAPLEASGTSGMKAAVNGVPSISILDGWWIEGCIEGVTGWAIGDSVDSEQAMDIDTRDANFLYSKLENIIMPLYYDNKNGYIEVMRQAVSYNASYFNTERMLSQYITKAYFR
ncbi:MAG: alpha-glucan family phosphorylase [Gammaproteobacteria bacterium]|nr:alpha-glucan family phosphorylase [Gammaproteobacteria bacterium]